MQTSVLVYEDDDSTTVMTSDVTGTYPLGEDGDSVQFGYLADAVSSASVDVVSAATGRWEEIRNELRLSGSRAVGRYTMSGAYRRSWENDYGSHTLSLGASRPFKEKTRTVSASLSVVKSDVGRSGDEGFSRLQDAYIANLGVVQIVNKTTLVALGYNVSVIDGYQSSPYRYVRVGTISVPEVNPEFRHRHALIARLRRSVTPNLAIHADQRIYVDSWGMSASTTSINASYALRDTIEVRMNNRLHYQGNASFYEKEYMTTFRYITSDRELSSLANYHVGASIAWKAEEVGPFSSLQLYASATAFGYRYFNSSLIQERYGSVLGAGADFQF